MIRPYAKEDQETLVELLNSNVPEFFAPSEVEAYEQYLQHEIDHYFVLEENGQILGAGGINYFPESKSARISWDIVRPDRQGRGLGRQLLAHRLEEIKKAPEIQKVIVRTSQYAYQFYQKQGFALVRREPHFWAEGFHLYQMEMPL